MVTSQFGYVFLFIAVGKSDFFNGALTLFFIDFIRRTIKVLENQVFAEFYKNSWKRVIMYGRVRIC